MRADFHLHSKYSDGLLSPREVIELIKKNNIGIASITDHDTVEGVSETLEISSGEGIVLLPGVEITTAYEKQEIHILGLNIQHDNPTLENELERLKRSRFLRLKRILSRLREMGIEIHDSEVFISSNGDDGDDEISVAYGRPHIAKVLIEKGYAFSYQNAFEKYIGDDCPACVPKEKLPSIKAIKLIKHIGGLAVLAHPEDTVDEKNIDVFMEHGLDGLEVYCPAHDDMQVYHYEILAKQKGLIVTSGTDMHSDKGYANKARILLDRDRNILALFA